MDVLRGRRVQSTDLLLYCYQFEAVASQSVPLMCGYPVNPQTSRLIQGRDIAG